jgi:transcriptional regulator with XRE-family HTH domain
LREFRERKEMSQEQLAAAAELDRSFISLVERGIQSPNLVVLLKIAEVLDVPAAELISKTEAAMRKAALKH